MNEQWAGVGTAQPPSIRAEQSKGVWVLGWLTILWSGLELLWFLCAMGLSTASKDPSASSWSSGFEQLLTQYDYWFVLKATSIVAAAYFLTGIGWIRARGWAYRALVQCTIAGILAVLVSIVLDAIAEGPSSFKFIMTGIWAIVPVGVLAYTRQQQVRRQFDPEGPRGAIAALLVTTLVFIGSVAPSVKRYAEDIAAKRIQLTVWERLPQRELSGKYVILSFWASWCGPCRTILPELQALHKNLATRDDVRLVGISLDTNRTAMERFAKRNAMTWPHVFDGKMYDNTLAKLYSVHGIPHELLLGPDGSVIVNKASLKDIEDKLKTLPKAEKFKPTSEVSASTASTVIAQPSTILRPQPMPTAPVHGADAIGIDMYHSQGWDGLLSTVQESGFVAVILDTPFDANTLKTLKVLVLGEPRKDYSSEEVQAVKQFVEDGGGLLGAGQAWSWSYYDKKPMENFPLNQIGSQLQFWVTENNIGAPKYWDTDFMRGITEMKREIWWPSRIEVKGADARPLIRDGALRIMGGAMSFGKGKIVLYGSGGLLQENPRIVKNSIYYLMGKKIEEVAPSNHSEAASVGVSATQ